LTEINNVLVGEVSLIVDTFLLSYCNSIRKYKEYITNQDCKDYIHSKIKIGKSFKNQKELYVFSKHRLIDLYRKVKNEYQLEVDFQKYTNFILDVYEINSDTLYCLLLSINTKFSKFIKNDKFISGKEFYYAKMNKYYEDFISQFDLSINPNKKEVGEYLKQEYTKNEYHSIDTEYKEVSYDDRVCYNKNMRGKYNLEFEDEYYFYKD